MDIGGLFYATGPATTTAQETMSYTFTIDNIKKMFVVAYSGEVTLAEREKAIKEGTPVISKNRFTKVLVDLREAEIQSFSAAEDALFASMISGDEVLRNCKTAFVVRPDQHDNDFIVMRATAKHYSGKQFTDIDAASGIR